MRSAILTVPCEQLARDRDKLRLLFEVSEAIALHGDLKGLVRDLARRLPPIVQFDYIGLDLYDPVRDVLRLHTLGTSEADSILPGLEYSLEESGSGFVFRTGQPLIVPSLADDGRFPVTSAVLQGAGVESCCLFPLTTVMRRLGVMVFGRRSPGEFDEVELEFLSQVASQVALAVQNALANREIGELKEKLNKEKLYLDDEIRNEHNFDEIVGNSQPLKQALEQIEIVAPTDSTVLIQGETGTGKELIARAIHNLSRRSARTFVKLNCAAIPTGLLESELFGHEKGAFTGAITQKVGRLELANGGTLFLDEVGDIPLELQSKFLRVLQEKEFERLGSTRTIRVDIRLVAATNRDLAAMVAERQFRSDLYYRLNVFPIFSPPLRERREDIPPLVAHFTRKFARRMNKPIETISSETMAALSRYHWPGNVRELENFVERAVILSRGTDLEAPLAELRQREPAQRSSNGWQSVTLAEAEREHILQALREANWRLGGPAGAAARLGMKRTTLQSKMARLGIERPRPPAIASHR